MTDLKELMDDAAAEAAVGLGIDLGAARERSTQSRDRLRFWGTTLMLTAAAALLALVVVPVLAVVVVRPASDVPGLPGTWRTTPADAPDVRTAHVSAAAMLLEDQDGGWTVVGAGGTRYARLDLGAEDHFPALSDDGRLLAWLSVAEGVGRVNVLRLADGSGVSTQVPTTGFAPLGLRWSRGVFEVLAKGVPPTAGGTPEPGQTSEPACFVAPVIERSGRLVSGGVLSTPQCSSAAQAATLPDGTVTSTNSETLNFAGVSSTTGRGAFVGLDETHDLRLYVQPRDLTTASGILSTKEFASGSGGGPVTSVRVLNWSTAGILIAVRTSAGGLPVGELRLVDPDTLAKRVLARSGPGAGDVVPMAVTPTAVGNGTTVPGQAAPSYPAWHPDRIAHLTRTAWSDHLLPTLTTAVSLVGLMGAGIGLRMRSKRRVGVGIREDGGMTAEYDLGGPGDADDLLASRDPLRRRRIRGAALVVAGVGALLLLVALPALAASTVHPPAGRQGLPDRWYALTAPGLTVADWPMRAAAMLLEDQNGAWTLASADGRRYARLPLRRNDSSPALSDDGRLVAWLHRDEVDGIGSVHILRLVDGRAATTTVPYADFIPVALRWNGGAFEVKGLSTSGGSGDQPAAGDLSATCFLFPVDSRPDRLVPAGVRPESPCSGSSTQAATVPAGPDDVPTYVTVHAPAAGDPRRAGLQLGGDGTFSVLIFPGAGNPSSAVKARPVSATTDPFRIDDARVLAWTPAGIVVQLKIFADGGAAGARRELRLIDPDRGPGPAVSTSAPGARDVTPLAVAPGVLGADRTVVGHAPTYPRWPAAAVALRARQVRHDLPWLAVLAVALPALAVASGTALLVRPGRRSRAPHR